MATLEIRKETSKVWRHIPSNDDPYIVSKLYIKSEGDNIRVVELGGSQRGIYNFADVSVYDIGGVAETFTSASELMQRLEALGYIGFFYEGEVSPSTLISSDLGNIIELGSDGKLYAIDGGGGSWGSITGNLSDQTDLQNALDSKVDKVTTAGVERVYTINADGSQGTKATSEFKDVLEFANLASFPVTGESGKIYVALDTNFTYRWSGSAYVQIWGSKKWENHLFSSAGQMTLPADKKNLHQSRFTSLIVLSTPGLTFGNGIPEVGGVLDLSYLSDAANPRITGNYISKIKAVELSYTRNISETTAGQETNIMLSIMTDKKHNNNMQLVVRYNFISNSSPGNVENKVSIPILEHLSLDPFSNIKWCVRVNNATAQTFTTFRLNVITEEI